METYATIETEIPIDSGPSLVPIDRLESPSPRTFSRDYVQRNKAAIITGVANKWPACAVWSPEYFKTAFPGLRVHCKVWDKSESTEPAGYTVNYKVEQMLLGEYIDRALETSHPDRRYYLAQFQIFKALPQLLGDIESMVPFMGIPRYVKLKSRLKIVLDPTLWMGPPDATSVAHFDSYENLFVQIYGRKRFILISPEDSKYLYYPDYKLERLHFSPVNVADPDLATYPLFKRARLYDFVLEPGEILFIPARWWHFANSIGTSISLNFWWRLLRTVMDARHYGYVKLRRRIFSGLKNKGLDLSGKIRF